MTREENIATLNEHLDHWKRLLSEKICDQDEGEKTIDGLQNAIKALQQEPCEDCISRKDTLNAIIMRLRIKDVTFLRESERLIYQQILAMPSVNPQKPKTDILDKIRAEITAKIEEEEFARSVFRHEEKDTAKAEQCTGSIMAYRNMIKLIDKYKAESEVKE